MRASLSYLARVRSLPLPAASSISSLTLFVAAGSIALLAITTPSCAIPASTVQEPELPDSKSFIDNKVSVFMERRCGSLDCHGHIGRPLRIYSEWGLRLASAADGTRNKLPTTADEQLENYRAVVGLEPENLSKCFDKGATNGDFSTFQLLKKPLSIEGGGIRHKGGPVLSANVNDKGWLCLFNWACGQGINPDDCTAASTL
jgi:hypothetical protein